MYVDPFVILCKSIALFIYGTVLFLSIIFTFFIDTYERIDELLAIEFLSKKVVNPLYANIDFIDDWLKAHHVVVGSMLTLLTIFDIFMLLRIIDVLL